MTIRPKIEAVLFDLDGTLVETHIDFPAMRVAMAEMARASGVPVEVLNGLDILGMVYAAAAYLSASGKDGDCYTRAAFAELERLEVTGCASPSAVPGAASTIATLRTRRIGVGIVTRNCRSVSERLVRQFDLTCDVLLTRDDVPRVKPDPDHLHRALIKLGVAPVNSAMVGDHVMDVQAGKNAGCTVIIGMLCGRLQDCFAECPPTAAVEAIESVLEFI